MPEPKSKLASRIASFGAKSFNHRRTMPLWKGPEVDGVTFSMLSRFLVCRERFRIAVVEGLRPTPQFNHLIEYGQMWHLCEECHASPKDEGRDGTRELIEYCRQLCLKYPTSRQQIEHWYSVCAIQFPLYVAHWNQHEDVKDRTPYLQEKVFDSLYTLPSGRSVRLRGKWDSVDIIGKDRGAGVYLQENKSKGTVDERKIKRQLTFDLQTMLYLVTLKEHLVSNHVKTPLRGVRYNVVKRPLSGGKGTIVQHKPTKKNPRGESKEDFYGRLCAIIKEDPKSYFMRWRVEIVEGDIKRFCKEFLDPVLEQLVRWYDAISGAAGNPFSTEIHWRHPFGVYNVLDEGGSSDLDEYITTGSEAGLTHVDKLFTELEQ